MSEIINMTSYILQGLTVTLEVYFITILFSIPLGIVCALGKSSKNKLFICIVDIYTWVFRGTPLLLQLVFCYYGLSVIGIKLTPLTAAAITFILNYGAYFTEIFRAGILSIDKGQVEGAQVLGMNHFQIVKRIILPQALKRVIPPTCNEAINLVKDTALVWAINIGDMLRNAQEIVVRDFTIKPLFIVVIIYLLLTFLIVVLFKKLEKRYSYYN